MNKKKLVALSLVVIMVAIMSLSSLAWFTAEDSSDNEFNVGGAGSGSAEDIFSIDVKENVDGVNQPVDRMTFDDVLPGNAYKKEAFVVNTGSYEQYVCVTLTISDWNALQGLVVINMDDDFATNWHIDTEGVSIDANGNLVTDSNAVLNADGELEVVMYLDKKLDVDATVHILDTVNISADADQNDFIGTAFADGFTVSVVANAAQTENILATYGNVEWENAKATFTALQTNP